MKRGNNIFTNYWIPIFILSYLKGRVKIKLNRYMIKTREFPDSNTLDWNYFAAVSLQMATWEAIRELSLWQSLCASEGGSMTTWKKPGVYVLFNGHIAEINMFNSQRNIYFIRWHNLLITLKLKHGAICSNNHDYALSGPNVTV